MFELVMFEVGDDVLILMKKKATLSLSSAISSFKNYSSFVQIPL
jgi:hypothetical protein